MIKNMMNHIHCKVECIEKKLIQKCERYRGGLANFYYIFDEHNLLDKKDAPCDKGQEVLETLMKRRIKIK